MRGREVEANHLGVSTGASLQQQGHGHGAQEGREHRERRRKRAADGGLDKAKVARRSHTSPQHVVGRKDTVDSHRRALRVSEGDEVDVIRCKSMGGVGQDRIFVCALVGLWMGGAP